MIVIVESSAKRMKWKNELPLKLLLLHFLDFRDLTFIFNLMKTRLKSNLELAN